MDISVYSDGPQCENGPSATYASAVVDVDRWSEAGFAGILLYTDNGIANPWLVSQVILENTIRLRPLVALQPFCVHLYTAAKRVASMAYLHGRAVDLGILAGGCHDDLLGPVDRIPHEQYAWTVEYGQIMLGLIHCQARVTVGGAYYHVPNLQLMRSVPAELVAPDFGVRSVAWRPSASPCSRIPWLREDSA